MSSSLIRGRYVLCRVENRGAVEIIDDGAIYQRDGRIVEVGKFADLTARHEVDEVIGSSDTVVLPGFVNGHHHVGVTPFQLGVPDLALELWWGPRLGVRDVDPYLDTLYSAIEMVASGVTTVQHIHGRVAGPLGRIERAAEEVLRAYRDIGMRVSYSFLIRDQNRLVYDDDEAFCGRLPVDIGPEVFELLRTSAIPLGDNFALFDTLTSSHKDHDRVRVQLAPANLHWCSDTALESVADFSERRGALMHIHLVETAYQKAYALKRTGTTAARHLQRLGLMGPRLTIGHGTWMTAADHDICAETGTLICTNCASNFRVRGGLAPLNEWERRGLKVAIGIDEAGLNDDRDMLQEMRLVLRAHRTPGMNDNVPTAAQVLRMATEHGAATTAFGTEIGTLAPGKSADLIVMDWRHIAFPYLDPDTPVVDAILQRGKTRGVKTVIVGGEVILRDGVFTRIDKDAVLAELAAKLSKPLTRDEARRRELARGVRQFIKLFYDGYLQHETQDPFYCTNSRT
ncbi:MAG: amidohydrolase family protein [Hyphomicrobiaceae bacterium]